MKLLTKNDNLIGSEFLKRKGCKYMYEKRLCVVCLMLLMALINSLDCFGETFPVAARSQEQEGWCWAACSESVLIEYGTFSIRQCDMANYVFSQQNCCNNVVWPNGTGSLCNLGTSTHGWTDFYKSKGVQSVIEHFGKVDSSYRPWAVSLSTLEKQSAAKAPWIIEMKYKSGADRHTILGHGVTGTRVSYMDPWPFSKTWYDVDYNDLVTDEYEWWYTTLLIKPKKITFAIDNTGSMSDKIAAAKAAATKVVDDNTAAGEHFFYTLITFKDGDGNVVGQTMDPDEIKGWISRLSASDGAGCQESSLTAVRQAANLVPDSEIFLMTDANSNSYGQDGTYATVGEILDTANVLAKQRVNIPRLPSAVPSIMLIMA